MFLIKSDLYVFQIVKLFLKYKIMSAYYYVNEKIVKADNTN